MILHRLQVLEVSVLLALPLLTAQPVQAAFSPAEMVQVRHLQTAYAHLSKKKYSVRNLYQVKPRLHRHFRAGHLKKAYIKSQLAYINYYRSLFALPKLSTTSRANRAAQKTAAVMASIKANPFTNQHGLPRQKRPRYISPSLWKLAKRTSETSNLNFNVHRQTAGGVITDLLTDHYNLSGNDTGHRAWLLSTRLSRTGIGACYGKNGYRYSVQKVLNAGDLFKAASKAVVAYPSAGLFPLELSKGKRIAWSLYLSSKTVYDRPRITITDLETQRLYEAKNVRNYSTAGYGNFHTILTYSPGKTPLIPGHQYQIRIGQLYQYEVKFFREKR